jgi:hypothetical protein
MQRHGRDTTSNKEHGTRKTIDANFYLSLLGPTSPTERNCLPKSEGNVIQKRHRAKNETIHIICKVAEEFGKNLN